MAATWAEEARRLARLSRLALTGAEADALAADCARITASFSDLASFAQDLPAPQPAEAGPLREDVARPAPADEVEGILRAAPKVDPVTRAVRAPRGLP